MRKPPIFACTASLVISLTLAVGFAVSRSELAEVPFPDLTPLEEAVRVQLQSVKASLDRSMADPEIADRQLSDTFGLAGRSYHAYEFWNSAATCYENASKLNPANFAWMYFLARVCQSQGKLEEAVSWYRKASELRQDYPALQVNLGNIYLEQNELESAEEVFRTALQSGENDAASHFGLGRVSLARKDYLEAIDHFKVVLDLVPKATRIHYSIGMAYRGLGDLEQARAQLRKKGPIGVRPVDPLVDQLEDLKQGERVHLLRGRLAYNSGDYRMAISEFQKASSADPASARAMVNLGTALAKGGDTKNALSRYQEAIRLDPDSVTAYFNLGSLLLSLGQHEEAVAALTQAIELEPDDSLAHWELAAAHKGLGNWKAALEQYSSIQKLHPAREEPILESTKMLLQLSKHQDALTKLEEAHERMPEKGRIAHALARILAACPDVGLRNGQRALELALRVYDARKTVTHAETVALALAESGRCSEALEWQSAAAEAAQRAGAEDLGAKFRDGLERYKSEPCRPPAR